MNARAENFDVAMSEELDIKTHSDQQLHLKNIRVGSELKSVTLKTLHHLNETDRRRLYSKFSCSSLHAYAVKFMKMDEATAGRHISATRLLAEIPEIEVRILNGSTQMTSVADAGVFFRKEARLGHKFDLDSKRELLFEIDNKTTRQVGRLLISKSANPEFHFKERVAAKTESITEVTSHYDQETMEMIERLREVWSHAMPHAKISDLVKRALGESLEKHDPLKKAERSQARSVKKEADPKSEFTPAQEREDEESPAQVRHKIWMRDQSRCSFVDPRTGERCASKHFVEEDHIVPKAMGGKYTVENMRLRCRAHNQRHAIETYGAERMRSFLN